MNRQARTLLVLGVALLAAFGASYGVYIAISRIPVREVEVATQHTVVAKADLPMGTLLTKDNIKLVAWPAATPLAGRFDTIEAVIDRGLIANVVENEPIVETKVAPKEAGAGLPPSIPSGMRAMSVRVNEVIGVAGFVVPGTRVDVMVIARQREEAMARVVVSNVQVLTAGTRYDQENSRDGKPIPSTVVTLLVSPEDAEKIALAQVEGQVMLSLRNPMDIAPTESRGVRAGALLGGSSPAPPTAPVRRAAATTVAAAPPPPPPPPPPAPRPYTVEAIRAAKRTDEVVK